MPRAAREKSSSGIYHVMLRGINKQTIFEDDEDNERFLQTIANTKKISMYELYAYCLMGNHVHFLLKTVNEDLSQIFRRIGASYVYWYNQKHNRTGHLFQDRYKSEIVDNDRYFITVFRYIHNNPVKAGLCKSHEEYKWSSYGEYITKSQIVDCDFPVSIIGAGNLEKLMYEESDEKCLEIAEESKRLKDEELATEIEQRFGVKSLMIQSEPKAKRNQIPRDALTIEGVSTRQLSRVTSVSSSVIWNL